MAKFVLNRTGFTQLRKSPGVVKEMQRRGSAVLAAARAGAPVETGAYLNSLQTWTEEHPSRTVVHVGSDVMHAIQVEGRQGTLSRAIDAAGGR